ncbi:MAG: hypothetical protein CMO55_09695 [Verrucomicrobiales bacterium]|nr:hypothetical protein [Verrucomicrobiales bacterium]
MGYRIEKVTGNAADNRPAAEFLARFVLDDELESPREGDDSPDSWQERMTWWWDENPFCREDSPKGFILYSPEGEIVGFNGLIPFDYTVDGEMVPSLVLTSFFVRAAHRSAVMGMLSRQRALSRKYHLIDGSPSPEMRVLLEKLGFQRAGDRHQFFFPLARMGGELSRSLLRPLKLSFELKANEIDQSSYLAVNPNEVQSIPELHDGKVRRTITIDSLEWLTRIGTVERRFVGLCDQYGSLRAYLIGIYKCKWGVRAFVPMDYVDLDPDTNALEELIRRIVRDPKGAGLQAETDILAWSMYEGGDFEVAGGISRESILHFQLPKKWSEREKACVPFESDLLLQ